jgi:hypothetical protein
MNQKPVNINCDYYFSLEYVLIVEFSFSQVSSQSQSQDPSLA